MATALGSLVVLLLLVSGIGYYGVRQFSATLDLLSGPAWSAADGAMESGLVFREQMLGLEAVMAKQDPATSEQALQQVLHDTQPVIDESIERMLASGLFTEAQVADVTRRTQNFISTRDAVLSTYPAFTQAHGVVMQGLADIDKFLSYVEVISDGQMDAMEFSPDDAVSWKAGLEDLWVAADGVMDGRIALLQSAAAYQTLVTFHGDSVALRRDIMSASKLFVDNLNRVVKLAAYSGDVPVDSGLSGSYQEVMTGKLSTYRRNLSAAVARFEIYRQALLTYHKESVSFLGFMNDIRDVGDSQVEVVTSGVGALQSEVDGFIAMATLVSIALSFGVAWWIARNVVAPVVASTRAMIHMGKGDLSQRLEVTSGDEIGQMAEAFNGFSSSLSGTIRGVSERASSMATATEEVTLGNGDLSQRTEEQAASLEETASSMEQMTANVHQSAENASAANALAREASNQAAEGGRVVSNAIAAMAEVDEASKKIANIVGMVGEIAFQTNLLALNASVEAARAGEQGRGFAVVATEVRNLAGRSASAVNEIKVLIEDAGTKVETGSKLVQSTGEVLKGIVVSIGEVSDMVSDIDVASQEQAEGIEQVNKAIGQMDEVTQQNAALVEQTAAISEGLSQQAVELAGVMAAFTVDAIEQSPPAVPTQAAEVGEQAEAA